MDHDKVGIFIIIAFIVIGIATGGEIFGTPSTTKNDVPRQQEIIHPDAASDDEFIADFSQYPAYPADPLQGTESISPRANVTQSAEDDTEEENASIYRDKIEIRDVRYPGTFREYITLSTNLATGETVAITGWKIRSLVTGNEITIGEASNILSDGRAVENPIVLSKNSRVIISQKRSSNYPSFRVNKCSGFIQKDESFFPNLSLSCPATINDTFDPPSGLNDACLDYIENLLSCEIPRERDYPEDINSMCENFIEGNINYGACVSNHRGDPDFLKPEWRVFVNRGGIIWREEREKMVLIDNFGQIVDTFEY